MGPYTGEQLVQYAQEGSITAETMVWADGMPEWAPASQVPGLIPAAVAPAATTSTAWAPPGSRLATGGAVATTSIAAASSQAAQAPVGGEYPFVSVKKSNFGLWLGMFLGGFICFFIGLILVILGGLAGAKAASAGGSELAGAGQAGAGGLMFFVGWVVSVIAMIFFYINIYRAWVCLQPGAPRTTPGKAVGFLFIPFFNIYWFFVAINGLPKNWNRIVSSYEDLKAAPKLSETTFLLFCIGIFIAPLALVMIFPVMSQICKGINFFAARRNAAVAATSTYSAFGGR